MSNSRANYAPAAFPRNANEDIYGLSKLEWMAGQVAAGMQFDIRPLFTAMGREDFAEVAVLLAKAILDECNKES